jgi:acyl-CoA reductase-like NAD-dependent aldehyde dehydrogenase
VRAADVELEAFEGAVTGLGTPARIREVLMSVYEVIDPATEDVVSKVELLDAEQVDAAVARSVAVGPAWRAVAPADRARLLRRFAAVVDAHLAELARPGGARRRAHHRQTPAGRRATSGTCSTTIGGAPERLFGPQIRWPVGSTLTFREPLGVVGIIVPWNFPMPDRGLGLRPGPGRREHRVLKPAELTPLTAIRLAELGPGGGTGRGRVPGAAWAGLGGGRAAGHPRAGPQDRLHRLHRRSAPGSCGWPRTR